MDKSEITCYNLGGNMLKGRIKYTMKLQKLIVKKLYDAYDYDVDFNNDITFLYGTNGCGKTTILNITEAIITGMLFKLFEYKFELISLQYYETKGNNSPHTIVITMEDRRSILVKYAGVDERIEFIRLDSDQRRVSNVDEIAKQYFDKYTILNSIRKSFNYVYLPLNRAMTFRNFMNFYDNDLNYYHYSRQYRYGIFRDFEDEFSYSNKDYNISQIELLIYNNYNRVNTDIRNIESNFRTQVLQSLLDVDTTANTEALVQSLITSQTLKLTQSKINEVKKQYISILRQLTSNDVDIHNCETFFDLLKNDINAKEQMDVTSWFRFKEFSRIQKTIHLAEKTQKAKEKAMSKFQLFIDTMNSFISQTEEQKEFVISQDGKIGFKTVLCKDIISPHHLSSGEKQLLIFFANLIFSVDNNRSGIFVVDEPELSLHLTWQRIFVEKTMLINPNMQLIFATHSPEFVGKYRDRMFKLEKKLS